MGNCCGNSNKPPYFKDCLKNINIKSKCFSSCCVNDSKVDNTTNDNHHHHHHHKHKYKHNKNDEKNKSL
jgi:hypothetical protein